MLVFSVLIISHLDSQFQMFILFSGRHIGVPTEVHQHDVFVLGSLNFCETFRRISEDQEKAQASSLERCLLYLSLITSQFLSFFYSMVFELFFLLRDSENDLFSLGLAPELIT